MAGRSLGSAAAPAPGPGEHRTGRGLEAVVYVDFACPVCAPVWQRLRALEGLALCVRHFPMTSKHPRAEALALSAEAAGRQKHFWEFADALFADHGRLDDPHLWQRARRLGLELDRFEADRRDPEVAARVRADFRSGIRAGVVGTPAAFVDGRPVAEPVDAALAALVGGPGSGRR
jgi:protein-disulfide isomerase